MTTTAAKRSIFRSKTIQAYIQNREKYVLPRLVAPPVFALCWIVLTLLVAAGFFIWYGQVPVYISGSGILLASPASSKQDIGTTAVIVFPTSDMAHLQAGHPIQIQIDPAESGSVLNARITTVSNYPLSPDEIHTKYRLVVAGPAIVVTVVLGPTLSGKLYAGSLVQAQIQTESQSLLSLFPVLNSL